MKNISGRFSEKFRLAAMHALVLLLLVLPSTVAALTVAEEAMINGIGGSASMAIPNSSGITISGSGSSGNSGKFDNPLGSGNDSLAGLLEKILNVVIQIGAVVVVFFYIYAGFKYVVARGDEAQIKSATKTLTWTTVGAMVILGAQVISTAIQGTVSQISSGK